MTSGARHKPSRAPLAFAACVVAIASLVGALLAGGAAESEPRDARFGAAVDINTAPADQLRLLPGVGPTLAERIVEEREAGGPFLSLDDLTRVKGIGPRTVRDVAGMARCEPLQ